MMSSPSDRRQRSSQAGTPGGRSTRNSQARNSPADGPSQSGAQTANTPRNSRASQLASSPLFYQSSPSDANGNISSPLRQGTDSQRTNGSAVNPPSSPLRQETHSQTPYNEGAADGDRTPRASGLLGGESNLECRWRDSVRLISDQNHRPSGTSPVRVLDACCIHNQICVARAAACLSALLEPQGQEQIVEATLTRKYSTEHLARPVELS